MGLKLFVDDLRRCPEGWTPARTITEAIRILSTMDVEEVSLDHDICCQPPVGDNHTSWETFEAVAWFLLAADPLGENIKVRIHTANPQGGKRMAGILGLEYNNEIYDPKNYVVETPPVDTKGDTHDNSQDSRGTESGNSTN